MTKKEIDKMKDQYKRIKNDLEEKIQDINPDKMEELYFQRAYKSMKLLWIDGDEEAHDKAEKELTDFIDKMTPDQRRAAIRGEMKAHYHTLFDLRLWLRREGFSYVSAVISLNYLMEMIKEDLELYDNTGDLYWYNQARDLLDEITGNFNKLYGTPEKLEDLKEYVDKHRGLDNLTSDEEEYLDFIGKFVSTKEALNEMAGN